MSDIKKSESTKSAFAEWLEKLQQESWQLELLISGFAIFGIYASRSLIQDLVLYSENEVFGETGFVIWMVVFIFKKGWLIFFINLIFHVILRGLWIGAIGLRYVSQEIDYDSFRYSERFSQYLRKNVGSYDDFIERLEKICSVIFAYTFLLFLLFASLMIFVLQIFLIAFVIQRIGSESVDSQTFSGIVIILYLGLGSLVFFDLITLGGLKKIREDSVSKIYLILYRYFSFATLSFLYRPLLYNFIDHPYTRKLFFFSIPYILFILVGSNIFINHPNPYIPHIDILNSSGNAINPGFYDDLRNQRLDEFPEEERLVKKRRMGMVTLEQFEISKPVSSFFIRLDNNFNALLEQDSMLTPYTKKGISFAWFNFNKVKDKSIDEIEKLKSLEMVALYNERRKFNKEIKKNNQQELVFKRDSISFLINERENFWQDNKEVVQKQKVDQILNKYLSFISVYIDTTSIPLDQCFFALHPHNEEEGIRCFFNTDSLSTGNHLFKFGRKYIYQADSLRENIIYLPFLKQ